MSERYALSGTINYTTNEVDFDYKPRVFDRTEAMNEIGLLMKDNPTATSFMFIVTQVETKT